MADINPNVNPNVNQNVNRQLNQGAVEEVDFDNEQYDLSFQEEWTENNENGKKQIKHPIKDLIDLKSFEFYLDSLREINQLNKNSEVIQFLNYQLHEFIPQEINRKILISNFINEIIDDLKEKYLYIPSKRTFLEYKNYIFNIYNEDDIISYVWKICNEREFETEIKDEITNRIIQEIKNDGIKNFIPESNTIQNVIQNFQHLFGCNKDTLKFILCFFGDILKKKDLEADTLFLINNKYHNFFKILQDIFQHYVDNKIIFSKYIKYWNSKKKFAIKNDIKYYQIPFFFENAVKENILYKIEANIYEFIIVCVYYSNRYKNCIQYINHECNDTDTVSYVKQITDQKNTFNLILRFKNELFLNVDSEELTSENKRIDEKKLFQYWSKYIVDNNILDIIDEKTLFQNMKDILIQEAKEKTINHIKTINEIIENKVLPLKYKYNNQLHFIQNFIDKNILQNEFIKKYKIIKEKNDLILRNLNENQFNDFFKTDDISSSNIDNIHYKNVIFNELEASEFLNFIKECDINININENELINILKYNFTDELIIEDKLIYGLIIKNINKFEIVKTFFDLQKSTNERISYRKFIKYAREKNIFIVSKNYFNKAHNFLRIES